MSAYGRMGLVSKSPAMGYKRMGVTQAGIGKRVSSEVRFLSGQRDLYKRRMFVPGNVGRGTVLDNPQGNPNIPKLPVQRVGNAPGTLSMGPRGSAPAARPNVVPATQAATGAPPVAQR